MRRDLSRLAGGTLSRSRRVIRTVLPIAIVLYGGMLAPLAAQPPQPAPPPTAGAAPGQQAAPGVDPSLLAPREYRPGQYLGPGSCASSNCHGNAQPANVHDVLQNEYTTWLYEDAHQKAYHLLLNDESARIARHLGIEKAASSTVCLECHATTAPKRAQANPLEVEDGISCETCHGPAGGWLARHNEEGFTHEDSVRSGMIDLRGVAARAKLCLGCHQGGEDRQVDHELIAAGHPELVFELDNYSEAMPAHWRPLTREAIEGGRQDTRGIRAWAEGQAIAFQEGLLQLARRCRSEKWPEFAEMSCDTCHHDLAGGEWRQVRGFKYRPGLPAWSPARYGVLRHLVVLHAAEQSADLDRAVEAVAKSVAVLSTPTEEVEAAARQAADVLGRIVPSIRRARWDEAQIRQLMTTIAVDADYVEAADRQTAEQAAMALQSLLAYLVARKPALDGGPLSQSIDQLFDLLENPYRFDRQRFSEGLAGVGQALR